jgi:hypothetical protein
MERGREAGLDGVRLSFGEGAWVLGAVLAWGLVAVALGKDTGWDFRNYHWYDAYALLTGRLGFDVAVAHQATYFNPLIHVPFYLLATAGTSWLAIFYAGALQGLNVLPLYLIGRSAIAHSPARLAAAMLTVAGMAGSTVSSMIGKTSYDQSALSLLVLAGLALVVVRREALGEATRTAAGVALVAGFLVGAAVGLKLTEAPFAVGFAAALALPRGSLGTRSLRLALGALGGLLGVLVAGGYWFLTLARHTGNPLFPFFNDVVHSALIAPGSYRDERFIPEGWRDIATFPFRFTVDYRVADDAPFHDLRVLLLYVCVPLAGLLVVAGRRAVEPLIHGGATRILFGFIVASYLAWIDQFAVYRYLVLLEMLAPIALASAIGLLPVPMRVRWGILGVLLLVTLLTGRYDAGPHAPLGDPYLRVSGLSLPHPAATMILMTGEQPMAYLIPSLPAAIPVLRIDGLMAGPLDGSAMTADMRRRVQAHRGDLFLLSEVHEDQAAQDAAAAYHLRIVDSSCQRITSNLGGPYRLCPLARAE